MVEKIGHTHAHSHTFSVSEGNGKLLFQAGVCREKSRHMVAVIAADNMIQIVNGGEREA